MRVRSWWGWVGAAAVGAIVAWSAGALAAGGSGQATVQTSVAVTPAVFLKVSYACGSGSCTSGTLSFGPANGGECEAGNAAATCAATNSVNVNIQSPGASTFALSAYDTAFTDGSGDSMPGSALNFSPCALGNCFTKGYVYDALSSDQNTPTPLWSGAPLAASGTNVQFGLFIGFPDTVWPTLLIPAGTPAGTYTNTFTLIVTTS
jgi:hypothetical protein